MVNLISIIFKWLLSVDQVYCESYSCSVIVTDSAEQKQDLCIVFRCRRRRRKFVLIFYAELIFTRTHVFEDKMTKY